MSPNGGKVCSHGCTFLSSFLFRRLLRMWVEDFSSDKQTRRGSLWIEHRNA
ncbi:unnamed protein product [Amoebophrya sp. A25]|nr:unnamed protein product [Amoebophrya sp. A25]|eukprot:GSA25T00028002001.1